jgi:hypothetical protein
MSNDQVAALGRSLASELRGTKFSHNEDTSTLHMSAQDPIHTYTELPDLIQDLGLAGMIDPQGKISADASAIYGVKKGDPCCEYAFLQGDDGTIKVLDNGAGRLDPNKDVDSMKITQTEVCPGLSATVRPGRVKVSGGDEWEHISTKASGCYSRNTTRPSSPLNRYYRRGDSPPPSPVNVHSRPPSPPNKRFGRGGSSRSSSPKREGSDDGNNSDY